MNASGHNSTQRDFDFQLGDTPTNSGIRRKRPVGFSRCAASAGPAGFVACLVMFFVVTGGCSSSPESKEPPHLNSPSGAYGASDMQATAEAHGNIIMSLSPEWATQMGVSEAQAGKGFQSRLSSYSPAANAAARKQLEAMRAELDTVDRLRLSGRDRITYDVMRFSYDMASKQNAFGVGIPSFLSAGTPYAVNQLFGPQIDLPRLLIAQQPVRTKAEVDAWLERLSAIERVLGELADATEADARRGVVPPYFALESIATSAAGFAEPGPSNHPIIKAFAKKLFDIEGLNDAERETYAARAVSILTDSVYPAYERFAARIDALVPRAGTDTGLWRLKNGSEMYQIALEAWGANGLSADEIHQIGLDDVARLQSEMDKILTSEGYADGTVGERMTRLAADPRFLIANTDEAKSQLVASLQKDIDAVMSKAPRWFLDIPAYDVEVRRIPPHEQDSAAGGYYTSPPLDGSRPGIFWINLKDSADVPTYTLKSLVFHEAVPGHHFQAGKSLSISGLPLIQNLMWFGDYGEGWALYAEELAKEMGMYIGDPLGDLGRYRMEIYRAARLVVDTGLHHKRWSRERAIEYMVEITGESRESITREVDRYAVWPGQATSYKLGMIQFQRLRKKAEAALGAAFDVREFHDVALRDGAMPMAALERRFDEWIESKRSGR